MSEREYRERRRLAVVDTIIVIVAVAVTSGLIALGMWLT